MTKLKTLQRLRPGDIPALLAKPGKHNDGGSLYLQVRGKPGALRGAWVFELRDGDSRRSHGIGTCPPVTLAEARKSRATILENRKRIPRRAAWRTDTATATTIPASAAPGKPFGEVVADYIAAKSSGWKDQHEAGQYQRLASINVPVNLIDTATVLDTLKAYKPNTAKRMRGRLERVLNFATALGLRNGDNPARFKGHLAHILPTDDEVVEKHHAALPYALVPALMKEIGDTSEDRALAFCILTAARRGEALGATWREIFPKGATVNDPDGKPRTLEGETWIIPGSRMKARKEHRVALSKQALKLIGERGDPDAYIFPGARGRPLYPTKPTEVLKRLRAGYDLHGMRSSFADWVAEETDFDSALTEMCLAHSVGSAVEKAYRRSDMIDKRRPLMQAWADFVSA